MIHILTPAILDRRYSATNTAFIGRPILAYCIEKRHSKCISIQVIRSSICQKERDQMRRGLHIMVGLLRSGFIFECLARLQFEPSL